MVEALSFTEVKDYRDWLARMRAVPTVIEQNQALLREGVKAGLTPPRVLMQRVPGQIAKQVVTDPGKSPFYKPFARFPDAIPAAERSALQAEAKKVISETLVPAYRRFGEFFDKVYLPNSRTSLAAADLPDGKAYYVWLAGDLTTTVL
ncbi:DUF885 family protein, partial [Lysobacter sp. 2RAB21]